MKKLHALWAWLLVSCMPAPMYPATSTLGPPASATAMGDYQYMQGMIAATAKAPPPPPQMDAQGRPMFDGGNFVHEAGVAYWCHMRVANNGLEYSMCLGSQGRCARSLQEAQRAGTALSGCRAQPEVTCFTTYKADGQGGLSGGDTLCQQTSAHCETRREWLLAQGWPARQLTACTALGPTFVGRY